MSWLNRVRQKIPFLPKRETPDNLWHKCRNCDAMGFTKEWEENLFVCPRCDHHGRIGPRARFEQLLDPGYSILPPPLSGGRRRAPTLRRPARRGVS